MSTPEWVTPGAEVVLVTHQNYGQCPRVEYVTIERVLKRDAVLSNGERINHTTCRKNRGTWDPSTTMHRPDDPEVTQAERLVQREGYGNAVRNRTAKIDKSMADYRKAPNDSLRLAAMEQAAAHAKVLTAHLERAIKGLQP